MAVDSETFEVEVRRVYPTKDGFANVLKYVEWRVVYTKGDHQSIAGGLLDLDVDDLNSESFIDIENITDETIKSWIQDEVGANIWNHLRNHHEYELDRMIAEEQLIVWEPPLVE